MILTSNGHDWDIVAKLVSKNPHYNPRRGENLYKNHLSRHNYYNCNYLQFHGHFVNNINIIGIIDVIFNARFIEDSCLRDMLSDEKG